MTPEQLASLEQALALRVPAEFRDIVLDGHSSSGPIDSERYVGLRPLLIHNLRVRDERRSEAWRAELLAVGNDGSGNQYVIDTSTGSAAVFLYEYEGELQPEVATFAEFGYDSGVSGDSPRGLPPEDVAVVARSLDLHESVLCPITLAEWRALVATDDSLELNEIREGFNPFTNETVTAEAKGRTTWLGPEEDEELQLVWGALRCSRPSEAAIDKLRELAARLDAHVLLG